MPPAHWMRLATNQFDSVGKFDFTRALILDTAQCFTGSSGSNLPVWSGLFRLALK
ncbi:MAG: hypothetical protein ABSE48_07330 [Verrucomicrobiota bacterium]